ncbi:hypothetical protein ACHAW6_008402, partial [Cyclotella cf. meneghiniana]
PTRPLVYNTDVEVPTRSTSTSPPTILSHKQHCRIELNTTMFSRSILSSALLVVAIAAVISSTDAFTANGIQSRAHVEPFATGSALSVFGKKKEEEDLSYIESRDLTREEMMEINKRNEEVMNRELGAMTGISVLFSIPMLYLCWVAFFSD